MVLAAPGLGGPVGASAFRDVLRFPNGDALHGTLMAIDPAAGELRWRHRHVRDVMVVDLDSVIGVSLAMRPQPPAEKVDIEVELTNDDRCYGRLLSLDGDRLLVDTSYAGTIAFNRWMVRRLRLIDGAGSTIVAGLGRLDEWTQALSQENFAWSLKNGVLEARSSHPIGRSLPSLPKRAAFEFHVSSRFEQLAFHFAFMSDTAAEIAGEAYVLRVSGTTGYMYRYTRQGQARNLGNIRIQQIGDYDGKMVKFGVYVDRDNSVIALTVDDVLAHQWKDTVGGGGLGDNIVFQPQRHGGLSVSRLRVSRWDGVIPNPAGGGAAAEEDVIRFGNGDRVSGHLETVSDGTLTFRTSYATLTVPVANVAGVVTATATRQRARRYAEDIRCHFNSEDYLTVRLGGLADDVIRGYSENFGDIDLPAPVFDRLEFDIYRLPDETGLSLD